MAIEKLPFSVKNSTWAQRQTYLCRILGVSPKDLGQSLLLLEPEIADKLIESAIGYFSVPLGVAWALPVNEKHYHVPLATEEPSVIAAANFMAKIFRDTPFQTEVQRTQISGQIYIQGNEADFQTFWESTRPQWENQLTAALSSMQARGGGYRSSALRNMRELGLVVWEIWIDPCDAQGANVMNTLLESVSRWLADQNWQVILKILSNDLSHAPQRASFRLPISYLATFGYNRAVIERLLLISQIGQIDPKRAVTHNKGIMNGITALALATGNDTRSIESVVHTYAARSGQVKALSSYQIEGVNLVGYIEMPLFLATVGGSTGAHPTAHLARQLLGVTSAQELSEVAIALGLAQNFAALLALASCGIQKGHMALHKRREALSGDLENAK